MSSQPSLSKSKNSPPPPQVSGKWRSSERPLSCVQVILLTLGGTSTKVIGAGFSGAWARAGRGGFCRQSARLRFHCMTGRTLGVIKSDVALERLVRVVASRATDSPVVRVTLAVKDAVRLKAHVVDLHALQHIELFRAAMTR